MRIIAKSAFARTEQTSAGTPNGYAFMALVNHVPVVALDWSDSWTLIGVPCDLRATGLRSDTMHGVSLQTCR